MNFSSKRKDLRLAAWEKIRSEPQLPKKSGIAGYLRGGPGWGTRVSLCDTSPIRKLRPPLSHTVYIEFGLESQAIVILSGGMQICLPLPAAKQGAILGFVDPITGEESSGKLKPLYITPVPKFWVEAEARIHATYILQRLSEEASRPAGQLISIGL